MGAQRRGSPMILGFAGKSGHGKDTAASFLVDAGLARFAFADPLKKGCGVLFDFTEDQLFGDRKNVVDERWKFTPRWALQFVGTDLFRNQVDPEFWVKRTMFEIDRVSALMPSLDFVISDVRFPNEVKAIADRGGVVYRVERPGYVAAGVDPTHASETALDGVVLPRVLNDGSLADFHSAVIEIARRARSALVNKSDPQTVP